MAKKKQDFKLDDFGFDEELDMPDFNFDSVPVADDRTPVTKFAKSFAGSVKDEVASPKFVKEVIRKSLPKTYGSAFDLADQTSATLRNLYNTSAKEIKPVINELKRTTKRVAESNGGMLPKSVAERLKKWGDSADKERAAAISAEQQRESSIQAELGNIFKAQTEQSAREATERDIKDNIRAGVEQIRHKDQMGQMDSMRVSLKKLSDYQDNVLANYHRKSLELQYRHYFVALDMLEEQKKLQAVTETNLSGILKNTAMPEFVKLKQSEALKETMRNRFMEALDDGIFAKRRNFIRNLGASVTGGIQERLKKMLGDVQEGMSMANMMLDQQEAMAEFGGGPGGSELAGTMAGGMVAERGKEALAKRLGMWMGKNEKIVRFGNKSEQWVRTLPQRMNRWAKEGDTPGWVPDAVADFLRDMIPRALSGPDTGIDRDSLSNLQEPLPYNRQANKSITEIIPGYLARIHQELRVMRTGDENVGMLSYDYTTNKFEDSSTARKNAFRSLFGDKGDSSIRTDVDDVMRRLDPEGNKLSAQQRSELGRLLVQMNRNNVVGDRQTLTDSSNFRSKYSEEYADLFRNYYGEDASGARENEFTRVFERLGSGASDVRRQIQDMVNAGMGEFLTEAGLIKDGRIDLDKVGDYAYGDQADGTYGGTGPANRRRVSRRRGGPDQSGSGGQRPQFRVVGGTNLSQHRQEAEPEAPQWTRNEESALANRDIVNAIRENTTVDIHKTTNLILERIEQRLNEGILTFGAGDIAANGTIPKVGWLNKTVGQSIRDIIGLVPKGINAGFGMLRKTSERVSGFVGSAFGTAKDMATKLTGWGKEKYDNLINDPRLSAWKLKAGEYWQEIDGKLVQIKSWKDVRGAIRDAQGQVILTAAEVQDAVSKSGLGIKIKKAIDYAKSAVGGAYNTVRGIIPPIYRFGLDTVKGTLGATLYRAEDVYVKGKQDPVLRKEAMKAGAYASVRTGKVISHPGQIDGAVSTVGDDGKPVVALTTEEFNQGLFDAFGKPLRTGLGKVTGFAKDMIGKGLGLLSKGWQKAKDIGSGVMGFFKNFAMPDGIMFSGGKKMLDQVTLIRQILEDRLPKRKKVAGDTDGDGDRDGSVQDLLERQKAKSDKLASLKAAASEGKDKLFGMGAGAKAALMAMFKKKEKDEDEDEDEDEGGGWLDTISDLANIGDYFNGDGDRSKGGKGGKLSRAKRRAGIAKRRAGRKLGGLKGKAGAGARRVADAARGTGIGGKVSSGLSRASGAVRSGAGKVVDGAGKLVSGLSMPSLGGVSMGAAGKLLGVAGTAYGTYSTYNNIKEGNYGEALLDAGLTATSLAGTLGGTAGITSMLGTAGSTAAAVGGGLLTAVAGILSSPVVLTGLGLAALGTAGYYGYKYLTRKKLDDFTEFRYAQYGFPKEDEDHFQKVMQLEDTLMQGVTWNGGVPEIDGDKINVSDIIEDFGIDAKDQKGIMNWMMWYRNRFKPVFLANLGALKMVDPKAKLDDVGGLQDEQKKKFFTIAKYPSGPYDVMNSPFPDLPSLTIGRDAVSILSQKLQEKLNVKSSETPGAAPAVAAAGITAAAAAASNAGKSGGGDGGVDSGVDKVGETLAAVGASSIAGQSRAGSEISVSSSFIGYSRPNSGEIDGLTTIRYKVYGLHEMVLDKVRALDDLEKAIAGQVSFDGKGVATWKGQVETLVKSQGSSFGVTGTNNNNAFAWMSWFERRFLPAYLAYRTAMFGATGKASAEQAAAALTAEQQVDVATAVYTAKTSSLIPDSVWTIPDTPWPGFEINTDSRSIEANLLFLKETAKKITLNEPKAKDAKAGVGADNGNPITNQANKSFLQKTYDALTDSVKAGAKTVWGAVTDPVGTAKKAASAVGSGLEAVGNYAMEKITGGSSAPVSSGNPIQEVGSGTGGGYRDVPAPPPGSSGKLAGVQATLEAVSRIVGLDRRLLETIAGIESGYKWDITPTGPGMQSSATGLFQFTKSTWGGMMKAYASKFGIPPGTPPTDPRANALLGGQFIKDNAKALKKFLKRPMTDLDLYMMHFLGSGDGPKFLSSDPNEIAAKKFPGPADSNKPIFYKNFSKKTPPSSWIPRTIGEIHQYMADRFYAKARKLGFHSGPTPNVNGATVTATAGAATPAELAPAAAAVAASTPAPQAQKAEGGTGAALTVTPNQPAVTAPKPSKGYGGSAAATAATPSTTAVPPVQDTNNSVMEQNKGFMPPSSTQSQSIKAQTQYQRESMTELLGPVGDTLQKSLGVQINQLDILKQLLTIATTIGVGQGAAAKNATANTPQTRPAVAAPAAPVPMSR